MNALPSPNEHSRNEEQADCNRERTEQQPSQEALDDPIKEEQYRQEYLRQLRLRSCPGCGETDLF
jgi:hypothetical protein